MEALNVWENFYIIVGSSGGALIGLTFVVITLISGAPQRTRGAGLNAFTTPTIVHFSVVLMVASLLSAPWQVIELPSVLLGLFGIGGLVYAVIVTQRVRRVDNYDLVGEDWLWYVTAPLVAYTLIIASAVLMPRDPTHTLFGVAGALLLLLLIGIHNAWDVVTYLATEVLPVRDSEQGQDDTKNDGAMENGEK